jgi:hypothetical protein
MTDGFLGNLGLAGVDATTVIPDGIHPCFVVGARVNEKDGKRALIIEYRIVDEAPIGSGRSHSEWWNNLGEMTDNAKSYFKRRLLQLGLPETNIDRNEIKASDLISTPVWLRIYTNKQGYKQIGDVYLRTRANVTDPNADPQYIDGVGYASTPNQAFTNAPSAPSSPAAPTSNPSLAGL